MTAAVAPWFASWRVQRGLLLLLIVLLLVNAVLSIAFKVTDFEWHLLKGRDFWFTRPYPDKAITYLLPRVMLDGLLSPLPPVWARIVAYPLAIALLIWSALACRRLAAVPGEPGWISWLPLLLAMLVLHPYIARDLNDCGPQIVTLACLLGGFLALKRERWWLAGLLLATAIIWKVTPLLVLGWLLLKRQWWGLGATLVCLLAWLLLPALVLGGDTTFEVYRKWLGEVVWGMSQADPTVQGIEPPRHQNQSLRMLVARYSMTFSPDHPINGDGDISRHWLYVTFADLAPAQAQRVYQSLVLALGALFAWRFRRRWQGGSAGEAREFAAVLILTALLSPLAWLHHFTVALPAAAIVARDLLAGAWQRLWRRALALFILVVLLLLQRDVVQRELSLIVLSYKLDAFAMWALVLLVLSPPRDAVR